MISEDKVRYMTKMAAFENGNHKKYEPMIKYFKKDYVGIQMIKSIVTATIAYLMMIGLFVLLHLEQFMDEIDTMDLFATGQNILLKYAVFLSVYLVITYIVYSVRYTKGRKEIKIFYSYIRKVDKINQREEKAKAPEEW